MMEVFGYFGLFAFWMVIVHMSLPKDVTDLKRRIKKLEAKNKPKRPKGENNMSNILKSIIGKKCMIHEQNQVPVDKCRIIEMDEEWVKVVEYDKKGKENHRIVRIDLIESISEIE